MSDERFGAYRVVETLGSGAISSIHKAIQEPLGRVVAVKALRTEIAPTSQFGLQLDREAKLLADLAHPNVVLLLDAGRTAAGRPYLVLEYVDGASLQAVLAKKRKLGLDSALAIAIGICAALEHAHERGVVHRDVKPTNVLLAKTGVVKVIDFGIAHRARAPSVSDAEGITPSGRMAPEPIEGAYGTPAYMSPEQILGDFVDARSDLFSLGVVLYQMASGTRPFESESSSGRASQPPRSRRETAAPLRDRAPDVPRGVERVVMRLLEKAPDDRYANATVVRERLERALRAITREDPAALVRAALAEAGFLMAPRKSGVAPDEQPRAAMRPVPFALAGHAAVLAAFLAGIVLVEGPSCSGREGRAGGASRDTPLELAPDRAGGLRVVATPWAVVKVDGQEVDTTPFARAIPLAPGKHWVTLTHPDSPPVEREVLVTSGETVTLDVTMPAFAGDDAGSKP